MPLTSPDRASVGNKVTKASQRKSFGDMEVESYQAGVVTNGRTIEQETCCEIRLLPLFVRLRTIYGIRCGWRESKYDFGILFDS